MRRLIRPIIGLLFSSLAGSLLAGTDLIVTSVNLKPENPQPGQKPVIVFVTFKNQGDSWMHDQNSKILVWSDWREAKTLADSPDGDGVNTLSQPRGPGRDYTEVIVLKNGAPALAGKYTGRVQVVPEPVQEGDITANPNSATNIGYFVGSLLDIPGQAQQRLQNEQAAKEPADQLQSSQSAATVPKSPEPIPPNSHRCRHR